MDLSRTKSSVPGKMPRRNEQERNKRIDETTHLTSVEQENLLHLKKKHISKEIVKKTKKKRNKKRLLTPKFLHGQPNTNTPIYVDDILNERFQAKKVLNAGVFGQVIECLDLVKMENVAIKLMSSNLFPQYESEVRILNFLTKRNESSNNPIIKLLGYFEYGGYYCIIIELLNLNILEILKQKNFKGIDINLVKLISKQVLKGIAILQKNDIIHSDLKPENIMLVNHLKDKSKATSIIEKNMNEDHIEPWLFKIIDFSCSRFQHSTEFLDHTYMQSKFYRSPEVSLGYKNIDSAIDVWSLGCIVFEMFWGLPLFPGIDQYDLLRKQIKLLGYPPKNIISKGDHSHRFFNKKIKVGKFFYKLKKREEYYSSIGKPVPKLDPKFSEYLEEYNSIHDIIMNSDRVKSENHLFKILMGKKKKNKYQIAKRKQKELKLALIDFLKGCLNWDAKKRWTAKQALLHPFITGHRFNNPYVPIKSSKSIPIGFAVKDEFGYSPLDSQNGETFRSSSFGSIGSNPTSSLGSFDKDHVTSSGFSFGSIGRKNKSKPLFGFRGFGDLEHRKEFQQKFEDDFFEDEGFDENEEEKGFFSNSPLFKTDTDIYEAFETIRSTLNSSDENQKDTDSPKPSSSFSFFSTSYDEFQLKKNEGKTMKEEPVTQQSPNKKGEIKKETKEKSNQK